MLGQFAPVQWIRRTSISRGLLGGNRKWLVVGGIYWTMRALRISFGKRSQIAAIEVLKPGQFVTIRTISPTSRRDRRRARSR